MRLIVLSCLLILTSLAQAGALPAQAFDKSLSRTHHLPDITHIDSFGDYDLEIIGNSSVTDLRMIGVKKDLDSIHFSDKAGHLSITQSYKNAGFKGQPPLLVLRLKRLASLHTAGQGNVTGVDIRGQHMSITTNNRGQVLLVGKMDIAQLHNQGSGPVRISGIRSHQLDITQKGSGIMTLNGVANLHSLTDTGSGIVSLYWLQSPDLTIQAKGKSSIRLAGAVDVMHATLNKTSHLDGKFLRVKKAFVRTNDDSRADLWVRDSMNTQASGTSNIYYYHEPKFAAKFVGDNGSVLKMPEKIA